MNISSLESLLEARIGLDPASIGPTTLPRVVAQRMLVLGIPTADRYTALVSGNAEEWSALVEALVVPETWFFRGGVELFDHLAKFIRARIAETNRTQRVLCVPCSCGEEPYSLAIALERAGISAARCTIDGVDLSQEHLSRASTATYPQFSFRESTFDPRREWFDERGPGRWELRSEIRDRVVFRAGNLVDPAFLAGEPTFDVILCRNLFIYLTAGGASRAMANLDRLLATDGRLCLTATEADRIPAATFIPDGAVAFAIFKRGVLANTGHEPSAALSNPRAKLRKPARAPQNVPPVTPAPRTPVDPLLESRRLADAGNLDAARIACEAAPATAARFSLLGVIHLAAGHADDATEAFRKALYLDPDDMDALMHMIVLCERRGESAQAAGLRRRLKRLEKGAAT